MKIGVISDTHNYFDPRIPELFSGVEHILHGGDIGSPAIITQLRQIAPVTAVRGNTDDPGLHYRAIETVKLGEVIFLLHHIVNPRALQEPLRLRMVKERAGVVVFGHTHKPFSEEIGGTLFFNPGYAGASRFGMERSIAILHCDRSKVSAEYVSLR